MTRSPWPWLEGRQHAVARLLQVVPPRFAATGGSPDPALTAHLLSAVSEYEVRLLLADPQTFGVERLMAHTRGLIGRVV